MTKKKKKITKNTYYVSENNTWIWWVQYNKWDVIKVLPEHMRGVAPFVSKQIPNMLSNHMKW